MMLLKVKYLYIDMSLTSLLMRLDHILEESFLLSPGKKYNYKSNGTVGHYLSKNINHQYREFLKYD
jgi:hypothetical protein